MDRRRFSQVLLGSAAAATALAAPAVRAAASAGDIDDTARAFAARRAGAPWTAGIAGLQDDAPPMAMQVEGRWPAGLRGRLLRNGPARHEVGDLRYHHLFDGDGMVQEYRIGADGITHRGRFVRTDKFVAERAAGRPMRQAFGTRVEGAAPPTSADSMNTANTSVVHHAGELLALWEGGSATRLDAHDLSTLGRKTWSRELAGMPFSAHPRRDADGSLWNFGVSSGAGLLSVYRIAPDGRLAGHATLPVPSVAMVHDFAITARHLVFLLPPLVFDVERARDCGSFLEAHVWQPRLGLRVLVLDKADPAAPGRWFELPAGFVFHIGNACEQGGVLRLDCVRSPDAWHATTGLRRMMRGEFVAHEFAAVTLIELDLASGRARQTVLPHAGEFPRVDPRVTGQRYTQVFTALRLNPGDRPGYDAVMRLHVTDGRVDHHRYGPDLMVEEHIFVPRPARHGGTGREGDGWLLGSVLDLRAQAMRLSVFDAQHLADGPIARATLPRVMPLGLHAIFVPEA